MVTEAAAEMEQTRRSFQHSLTRATIVTLSAVDSVNTTAAAGFHACDGRLVKAAAFGQERAELPATQPLPFVVLRFYWLRPCSTSSFLADEKIGVVFRIGTSLHQLGNFSTPPSEQDARQAVGTSTAHLEVIDVTLKPLSSAKAHATLRQDGH